MKVLLLNLFFLSSLLSLSQHHHADHYHGTDEICSGYFPNARDKKNTLIQPEIPAGVNVRELQSNPGAVAVLYIEFDGGSNAGRTYAASGMSDKDIYGAWRIAAEDFLPFDVNLTTDRSIYDATDVGNRHICFISNTQHAPSAASGYNFGGFGEGGNSEGLVMSWIYTGEVISHELGHAMGLVHSRQTFNNYYSGQGYWGPIMGDNYTRRFTQWDQGEFSDAYYSDANAANLSPSFWSLEQKRAFYIDKTLIISTTKKADNSIVGFRADDHGSSIGTATNLILSGQEVLAESNNGIISERTDLDFFSFTLNQSGTINLEANVDDVSPNLNIELKLYDDLGNVMLVVNGDGYDNLGASLSLTLPSGKYYISVDGAGEGDPQETGFSDYGSLGYFSISGTIEEDGGVPNQNPIASIISPQDGATVQVVPGSDITFELQAEDTDGTIETVNLNLNGADYTPTLVSGNNYTLDWRPFSPVEYTATWTVTDNDGATNTVTSVFTVAWVVPVVEYTVTFDSNGGDAGVTTSELVEENATATLSGVEPSQVGFIFVGWNTESTGTGTDFTLNTIITEDLTVYAQWEQISTSLNTTVSSESIVYPNPVVSELKTTVQGTYEIYNLVGNLVMQGDLTEPISLEGLPQGNYLIQVRDENNIYVNQFVKH